MIPLNKNLNFTANGDPIVVIKLDTQDTDHRCGLAAYHTDVMGCAVPTCIFIANDFHSQCL
jgi:hypothetical protein